VTTAAEWQVKVAAQMDASGLQKGSETAQASVKDLESQVDRSTEDINSSLRHMDDGITSSLGSGGTFTRGMDEGESSVGRLKDSVEEIPGAMQDLSDGAASAAAGLANAFASMGPAGITVGAVLAGFSILKTKAEATAQAMRDRVNSALDAVEIKAKMTNAEITKAYEKQLTFQKTVADLGGGDQTKGYGVLLDHAHALGVQVEDIVALINHEWSPGALKLRDLLRQQQEAVAAHRQDAEGIATRVLPSLSDDWQFIADKVRQSNQDFKQFREVARDTRDYMRGTADASKSMAGWLAASEARAQGIVNKLSAAQKFYGGLPQ
jgi:methyl-accepting chemotaxis protein